jgi:plastocyanin
MLSRGKCLIYGAFSSVMFALTLAVGLLLFPSVASAQQTWHVQVGAESQNEAKQADAFLPNEIWIYAGDSITFKFSPKNEVHTVTFIPTDTNRPGFQGPPGVPVGCAAVVTGDPAVTPEQDASYGGSGCVNSGPLNAKTDGGTYTVTFPDPGNYKMVCLVHADMNGVVHVLPHTATLPYDQFDYNRQARDEARDLLNDTDTPREERADFAPTENVVLMTGDLSATAGGRQYVSIVRFVPGTIQIHAGEAVEWINTDPTEPHTVTFGAEPPHGPTQVLNATPGPDGALEATIASPLETGTSNVSSGFLQAAPQDRTGLGQSAPGVTRLRITFPNPGTYQYKCALHDVDGMVGKVVVLP